MRGEIEIRAREIGLELVLSGSVEQGANRLGEPGVTGIVLDLDPELRAAARARRETDEARAVDDGSRNRSPADDHVRHVFGYLRVPGENFPCRRHDFPPRTAILKVCHAM